MEPGKGILLNGVVSDMNDDSKQFLSECEANIERQGKDTQLLEASIDWIKLAGKNKYSFN